MQASAQRFGVVALVAAAIGFAGGRLAQPVTPPSVTPSAAPPPSPPSAAVASASSAPSSSPPDELATRAARGELDALKALDARATRTSAEALALEAGHAELARREGAALVADVAADPALLDDPSTATHAYRLALDPAVAPTLLAGLAAIAHPRAADLLFDLAIRAEPGARLALLADDLLLGTAREHASKPLLAALALRDASTCERVRAALGAVQRDADDRALRLIARADARAGCGPKRADDCWACLREGEGARALDAAREAARSRPFAAPWNVTRR